MATTCGSCGRRGVSVSGVETGGGARARVQGRKGFGDVRFLSYFERAPKNPLHLYHFFFVYRSKIHWRVDTTLCPVLKLRRFGCGGSVFFFLFNLPGDTRHSWTFDRQHNNIVATPPEIRREIRSSRLPF
ncbi:unnamed protein product [Hapterophycus canaliculatus]